MNHASRGSAALKLLLALLGAGLSALLVSTAFFQWHLTGGGPLLTPRFSIDQFFDDLPGHLGWLIPFCLLSVAVIPLRAVQWQCALQKPVPFKERYHLVAIGSFTHNALPGKLGDFIRAFLLSRTQRIPFLQCLGSVAVCKLLEFAALMLLVAVSFLGPFASTMVLFRGALQVAIPLCVGLVALMVFLAHYAQRIARALHRRSKLPRLQIFLEHLWAGLGTARSFRGMMVALFFSVGPVLAPAVGYGLGLQGLGIQGGLFAGAVVLGAIALGQALPGIPAGMGLYYFVTSWAARSLGASPESAAAFSTLTHLATVFAQVSVGAVSVYARKIRFKDLRRGGSLAREAANQVSHEVVEPARA